MAPRICLPPASSGCHCVGELKQFSQLEGEHGEVMFAS